MRSEIFWSPRRLAKRILGTIRSLGGAMKKFAPRPSDLPFFILDDGIPLSPGVLNRALGHGAADELSEVAGSHSSANIAKITARLQELAGHAESSARLTGPQRAYLRTNQYLAPAFMGERVDTF